MEEEKIINGNCWVACFDILGFKKAILDFEQSYGVGRLNSFADVIYREVLDTLNRDVKDWQGRVYTCWASDTFVFYTPDDTSTSFNLISAVAINFFCRRIWRSPSYMMRGALGTGQFYADKQNNIFLGSALIDAYGYAEKQNWIGFVGTPSAEKKIADIETIHNIQPHNLLYQYTQYDVPVKKKVWRNEIRYIVEDTELLFAAKIQSYPAIKRFFQPRRKGTPQKEWAKKHENTRRFFEQHP
jgi:hypothetical protein